MPLVETECTNAQALEAVQDAMDLGAKKIELAPAQGGKWKLRITT